MPHPKSLDSSPSGRFGDLVISLLSLPLHCCAKTISRSSIAPEDALIDVGRGSPQDRCVHERRTGDEKE